MKKLGLLVCMVAHIFADERTFIDTMHRYVPMTDTVKNTLYAMTSPSPKQYMKDTSLVERPLYRAYPSLQQTLPHIVLGDLPTPIYHLTKLENYDTCKSALYLKDDGVTGMTQSHRRSFGGNKIRKLEFLFADALAQGAQSVMTRGGIGSNHVVATAVSAKQLGLRCIAMLNAQDVTDVVKRNMLFMHENDVDMILNPTRDIRNMQVVCSFVQNKYNYGDMPYFIPTGGSCPLGVIGYVNAVFELKEQITAGIMPEPDYIYVAAGSCGTLSGLVLGVRAAGLKTKVIGVAVEPNDVSSPFVNQVLDLVKETNALLHVKDASFPCYAWQEDDVHILYDFGGPDYGVVTPEALEAIKLLHDTENIQLDTTYTGKACAGMLHEITTGKHTNDVILFWNTFCAQVPNPIAKPQDLAPAFQQFFKEQ